MYKHWFKAKRYGWGWQPSSWQGWLVLMAWIASNVAAFLYIDSSSHSVSDTFIGIVPFFLATAVLLLLVCYATGETPRWRWGDDDADQR